MQVLVPAAVVRAFRSAWFFLFVWWAPGFSHAQSSHAGNGPYEIPYELVDERYREKVRDLTLHPSTTVPMDRTEVRSAPEVYDFLLGELPFTASLVRALGKGAYDIWRATDSMKKLPDDPAELERLQRTFYLDDQKGLRLKAVLVHKDERRWIYYTYGRYSMAPFPTIAGRSIIVVTYTQENGILETEARVYARVDGFAGAVSGLIPGMTDSIIRDKSALFIQAARTVAEMAHREPSKLYKAGRQTSGVDPKVLERFRERFLKSVPVSDR